MQPIFIGDVQGCVDELEELLERAEARYGRDFEAWIVGDLVNRGPGSLRILRRVRKLVEKNRARVVLGNHEISLLLTALGLRPLSEFDSFTDVLDSPDLGLWVEWLRRLPLLETGQLGSQPFAMVHASVHPEWDLEELSERARSAERRLAAVDLEEARRFLATAPEEDEERDTLARLTRCRSSTRDGGWSAELPDPTSETVPWHELWSARRHDYGIVYGHWALQGLHVAPRLRGLDTGCVHHGRGRDGSLTAWLPEPTDDRPFDVPDGHFWHVAAHRTYYTHRDE